MTKYPLIETWTQAICSRNLKKLLCLYEEDALLHPTLSPQICHGLPAIKKYFTSFLQQGITKIDYRVDGELYIDHALILMGKYKFTSEEKTLIALFTFVVKEMGAEYKILAHHSSVSSELLF